MTEQFKSQPEAKIVSGISSIVFDWKRTLYDPKNKTLIDGSCELLEMLKGRNISLFLIGKGDLIMHQEVERLGAKDFFKGMFFAEGDKSTGQFESLINKDNPSSTIIIGDRARSELAVGKSLNATTIWVKQGQFADELPEDESQTPDYTVQSLHEVKKLLEEKVL